jgi:CBS domain-containing protein
MTTTQALEISPVLFLDGKTAQELMTPNVVSISITASLEAAVFLLTDKRLCAVPVMDETGEPVGVLSRTDIVAHDFQRYQHLHQPAEADGKDVLPLNIAEASSQRGSRNGQKEDVFVGDVMTKVLYSVTPKTPAKTVIDAMLAMGIHRLFVSDNSGKLKGVISSTDVLRHLHEPMTVTFEQVELLTTDRRAYEEACSFGEGC